MTGQHLSVEFADKILILAVLEQWFLQLRDNDFSFVYRATLC